MGASMCRHLQAAHYRLTLFTRNRGKASAILAKGATWADSPRAVAEQTDILITMVGFPRDVRQVYFGDHGVLAGAGAGMVLVDMTTTEPSLAQEIAQAAQSRGVFAVDAPVSEGILGRATQRYRSWSVVKPAPFKRSCRCSNVWAKRSFTKAIREPVNTRSSAIRL